MKLQPFFAAQERLDKKVVQIHGLEGENLTADVTTALYVEIGELCAEIEHFKYWKKNKKSNNRDRKWDEWADCFHFILSLGNKYGHSDSFEEATPYEFMINENNFNWLFMVLFTSDYSIPMGYNKAIRSLITIGHLIGMTEEDMHQAYFEKNRVNYERLASGY